MATRLVDAQMVQNNIVRELVDNSKAGMLAGPITQTQAESVVQAAMSKSPVYERDKTVYRIAVSALSLAVVGTLGGAIWLGIRQFSVPDIVVAIGSGALGALAGLFAPSPGS